MAKVAREVRFSVTPYVSYLPCLSSQDVGAWCAGFLLNEMLRMAHLGFALPSLVVPMAVVFTVIFLLVSPFQPTFRCSSISTVGLLQVSILSIVLVTELAPPACRRPAAVMATPGPIPTQLAKSSRLAAPRQ